MSHSYPNSALHVDVNVNLLLDITANRSHSLSQITKKNIQDIFDSICKNYSLGLKLTPRLESQIKTKASRFVSHYRNSKKGGRQKEKF